MKRTKTLPIIIISLLIQACGQTGPLYLPDEPSPVHIPEKGQ